MKKSISSPCLPTMASKAPTPPGLLAGCTKRNSISCNSFSTLLSDINMSQQLEIVTHAPAYKVGMCIAESLHSFPHDLVNMQSDLATCIMTPDDSDVPSYIYNTPPKHPRVYENETRAGDMMMRVRKGRRRAENSKRSSFDE